MTLLTRKEISDFLAKTAKQKGATVYRIVTDSAKGDTPLKHNQGKAVLDGSTNYTVDTLLSVCRSLGVNIGLWVTDVIPPQSEKVKLKDLSTPSKGTTKDLNEKKKSNYSIDTMPVRMDSESSIDFAARKSEWKKKQLSKTKK